MTTTQSRAAVSNPRPSSQWLLTLVGVVLLVVGSVVLVVAAVVPPVLVSSLVLSLVEVPPVDPQAAIRSAKVA